jgi:hypothetical protein
MSEENNMQQPMLEEEMASRLQQSALLWTFGEIDIVEYMSRDACTVLGVRWEDLSPDEWIATKDVVIAQLGPYVAATRPSEPPVYGRSAVESLVPLIERYDQLTKLNAAYTVAKADVERQKALEFQNPLYPASDKVLVKYIRKQEDQE